MKGWKEFDEQFLTPFKNEGDEAIEFMPCTVVFSYTAIRHIAHLAFKAGVNSQKDK